MYTAEPAGEFKMADGSYHEFHKRDMKLGLSDEAKYSVIAACATFAVVVFIFIICKWARNWQCGNTCFDKNSQSSLDSDIDEKEHGWSSHIVWGQPETSDYESDVNGFTVRKPRPMTPSFMPFHPQARTDYSQLITDDDSDIPRKLDSGILSIKPVSEQSLPLSSSSLEYKAKLRFSLHALIDILRITIHEIKDIPPRMDDAMNTYVKASLSLAEEAKRNGEEQYSKDLSRLHNLRWQTAIQKKSLNPVYEERFEAEVPENEIWKYVLNVEVFEYDRFSRDYSIGALHFPLRGLRLADGRTFWQDLKPTKQESLGEILFTLNYLPTAEKLTIVVIKVKDMATEKVTSQSKSMFVKICLVQHYKQVKKKTRLHKISKEIVLNDSISFDLPHEHLDDVRAILFLCIPQYTSRSGSLRYDVLGQVMVGSGCRGPGHEHWVQMTRAPRRPIARWHMVT